MAKLFTEIFKTFAVPVVPHYFFDAVSLTPSGGPTITVSAGFVHEDVQEGTTDDDRRCLFHRARVKFLETVKSNLDPEDSVTVDGREYFFRELISRNGGLVEFRAVHVEILGVDSNIENARRAKP